MKSIKSRRVTALFLFAMALVAFGPAKSVMTAEKMQDYIADARTMSSADLYLNGSKNTRSTAEWTRKAFY